MQAIIYRAMPLYFTKALPKLIETVWQKGNKILIYSNDKTKLLEFDNLLWTYEQLSFLPHVTEDDELNDVTPIVLVSKEENLNNANVMINLELSTTSNLEQFEKVLFMCDLSEADIEIKIKNLIEQLKIKSIEVIEYLQDKTGVWKKMDKGNI